MSEKDAVTLKAEGNEAYRTGSHSTALQLFSAAIALDPKNETLYCNRSMCHAALLDWKNSAIDAKDLLGSIQLNTLCCSLRLSSELI